MFKLIFALPMLWDLFILCEDVNHAFLSSPAGIDAFGCSECFMLGRPCYELLLKQANVVL